LLEKCAFLSRKSQSFFQAIFWRPFRSAICESSAGWSVEICAEVGKLARALHAPRMNGDERESLLVPFRSIGQLLLVCDSYSFAFICGPSLGHRVFPAFFVKIANFARVQLNYEQ